jgi:hypothetical protein
MQLHTHSPLNYLASVNAPPPSVSTNVAATGQVLHASAQHWVQLLMGALLICLGIAPLLHQRNLMQACSCTQTPPWLTLPLLQQSCRTPDFWFFFFFCCHQMSLQQGKSCRHLLSTGCSC